MCIYSAGASVGWTYKPYTVVMYFLDECEPVAPIMWLLHYLKGSLAIPCSAVGHTVHVGSHASSDSPASHIYAYTTL